MREREREGGREGGREGKIAYFFTLRINNTKWWNLHVQCSSFNTLHVYNILCAREWEEAATLTELQYLLFTRCLLLLLS